MRLREKKVAVYHTESRSGPLPQGTLRLFRPVPSDSMHAIICGSRDYANAAFLFDDLDRLGVLFPITGIIHGAQTGADTLAGRWARLRRIPETPVPADWDRLGAAAGPERNRRMVAMRPDLVIAFPGGTGTADMMRQARAAGIRVHPVHDPSWRPAAPVKRRA
jgi:hypothetical protein